MVAKTLTKWAWEHGRNDLSLKYNFLTAIERNKRFWEQRRPIMTQVARVQSAEFIETGLAQQKFINGLRHAMLSVLAVPIYSEALHPTSDLQGLVTLPVEETLTEFWNTERAEIILVKSLTQDVSELRRVSQINTTNIVVTAAVSGNFLAADTIIYPCFPGIITGKQVNAETGTIFSAKLEFKELFLDWTL